MAKTVKITTDNHISIVDVPWDAEAMEGFLLQRFPSLSEAEGVS